MPTEQAAKADEWKEVSTRDIREYQLAKRAFYEKLRYFLGGPTPRHHKFVIIRDLLMDITRFAKESLVEIDLVRLIAEKIEKMKGNANETR